MAGSIKVGAAISFIVLLLAYFYKRHTDDLLQARLQDVLSGLLKAEQKVPLPKAKVAVGFGGCEDIFVNGLQLLKRLNLTAPDEVKHHNFVNNAEELAELMAFFFSQGAASE